MRIDSSGNVGIGGTPTHKLYVRNDVAASTDLDPTTIKLYNNSDGGSGIEFSNAVSGNSKISFGVESTGAGTDDTFLAFSTSANTTLGERMRIDSSGNVGIGGTFANKKLYVLGDTTNYQILAEQPSGYAGLSIKSTTVAQTWSWIANDNGGNSDLLLYGGAAAQTKLTIDSSGNVGIGTDSPTLRLDVRGTQGSPASSGTSQTGSLSIRGTGSHFISSGMLNVSPWTGWFQSQDANNLSINYPLALNPNGGNVGIGTTSPDTELHIAASKTGTVGVSVQNTNSSYSSQIRFLDSVGTEKSALTFVTSDTSLRFYHNGSDRIFVKSDGNVGIGITTPYTKLVVGSRGTAAAPSILAYDGIAFDFYNDGPPYKRHGIIISQAADASESVLDFNTKAASGTNSTKMTILGNGNVGIGTNSPDAKLEVQGVISSADSGLQKSTFANVGNDLVLTANADATNVTANILFKSSGSGGAAVSEKMRIDSSGNLTVGNSSYGSSLGQIRIINDAASNPASLSLMGYNNVASGGNYASIDLAMQTSGTGGQVVASIRGLAEGTGENASDLGFYTATGGTLAERMRIDSSGNVAIQPGGATLTNTRLNVVAVNNYDPSLYDGMGGIRIGTAASGVDGSYTGGIGFAIASGTSGIAGVQNGTDSDRVGLAFFTHDSGTGSAASAEAMRITSAGNLLVGATANTDVSNLTLGHLLEAYSANTGLGAVGTYNNSGTANCPSLVVLNRDTSTDSTNVFMRFYANVTSSGATSMGGIVGNGANNVQFAALSDIREKENVKTIKSSLDKISKLNPVEFDWKKTGEHINAGFIAQEVEEIFPEYVVENTSNEGEEERKGLTGGMTSGIVAHLVKAIQELKADNDSLKARIEILENN